MALEVLHGFGQKTDSNGESDAQKYRLHVSEVFNRQLISGRNQRINNIYLDHINW